MSVSRLMGIIAAFGILVISHDLAAQNDSPGSKDHSKIPRIDGAVIYGYSYSDHDAGLFLTQDGNKYAVVRPEGKRTRILYIVPRTYSRPAVWKNYGTAFEALGKIENIWNCIDEACPNDIAHGVVWARKNQIPTTIEGADKQLYQEDTYFNISNYGYAYLTVAAPDARYHISIFSAEFTKDRFWILKPDVTGTRSIHIEIVEEADFEPTLTVVTSEEITKGITEKGKIALYGINFDFDSDTVKPDSKPALEAIATTLRDNQLLTIYVVGHTDNQGGYAYNLSLSNRRAAAVVKNLTDEHEIASTRLIPVGVGPVAPVASNRSEKGQALNRRVELVEF